MGLSTEQTNKLSGGGNNLMVAANLAALNQYKTVYNLRLSVPLASIHALDEVVTISGEDRPAKVNVATVVGDRIIELKFDKVDSAGRGNFNIDPDAIIMFATNPQGNVTISEVLLVTEVGYTAKYEGSFGVQVTVLTATSGNLVYMVKGEWNQVAALDWAP